MNTFAIDFESYYDKGYSLKKMDVWSYVHHPRFDCYLMSVYGNTEAGLFKWVGHPRDFEHWELLNNATLLAHNAAFDSLVFKRLQSIGIIPVVEGAVWRCTASMAVYLSAPRSLKGACEQLLGIEVDKSQREDALGRDTAELSSDSGMVAYAMDDARLCYQLWDRCNHLWPVEEQELATLTYQWGQRGIAVNSALLEESFRSLESQRFNAAQALPWVDDLESDTPLSRKKLAEECRAADIPCPVSLALDDPECAAWEEKYGADYAWVEGMRVFRRTNMLLKRFSTVRSRLFDLDGVQRFPYSLKYFGAVPGRWSGDAGFNVQNMPRAEMFGADLRRCFIPSPGNVFVIADLSQIEPRVLAWLVDDEAFLDQVRSGVDIYEAHARSTMGYTDLMPLKKVDPAQRSLAKARTLGLGYGCGARKFIAVAKNLGGIDITYADAKRTVQDFRSKNPKITRLWRRLDREFKRAAGGDYHIELPSSRELRYFNVRKNPQGRYVATTARGGRERVLYGGLLTENLVQATARDVFASHLLAIQHAGLGQIVFHVHDEVILEVPASQAEQARESVLGIMSTTPEWLEGCPIEADATINKYYTK